MGFPISFSLMVKISQTQPKTPEIDPKTPLKVVKTPHTQIQTCWKYFSWIGRNFGFWGLGTYTGCRGPNEAIILQFWPLRKKIQEILFEGSDPPQVADSDRRNGFWGASPPKKSSPRSNGCGKKSGAWVINYSGSYYNSRFFFTIFRNFGWPSKNPWISKF